MGKCKYHKKCEWYDQESVTCNKTDGMYYGVDGPAGCYQTNAKNENDIQ